MATHGEGHGESDGTRHKAADTGDDPGSALWELGSRRTFGNLLDAARRPERIGPYVIKEILGEGGMGVVYLAEQTAPVRRTVALKLVKRGMDSREVIARFESERQALAVMNHPGIARVFDAGTSEGGSPYFVMEYVAGKPITEYCRERGVPLRDRLELFVKVCEAVQHAHQKAIIHRDLKPSNVLVTEVDGVATPKVIDFGIAKAQGDAHGLATSVTVDGQLIGTPEYMSPEQAGLDDADVDTRTDIYALGVILYELLTGVLPFEGGRFGRGGIAELFRSIREVVPPRPSTRLGRPAPELRGDLDWIVLKALEKDRTRRYASASELAADVRRHLRHEPVLAGPPGAGYRLKKLIRRQREKFIAAGVLVVLLIAAALTQRGFQTARSEEVIERGKGLTREFIALREKRRKLDEKLRSVAEKYEWWQPEWERGEEVNTLRALAEVRPKLEVSFGDAVAAFNRAAEAAPFGSPMRDRARRELEGALWERYREAFEDGSVQVPAAFFRAQIESLDIGTYASRLEGIARVRIESDPPGAEVHCFRYEEVDLRLLPLPFHGGAPLLVVEKIWDASASPLHAGDRVIAAAGVKTRTEGDLARALASVRLDEEVVVEVVRGGENLHLPWVPFRSGPLYAKGTSLRPGKLVDPYLQLDVTFEGYPLDFGEDSRAGETKESAPLDLDLPAGSYLIVLRKEGHVDARLPLWLPKDAGERKVRLYRPDEMPEGFVQIAAGPFPAGGDEGAYEPLLPRREEVGEFFMARLEVTFREYLEFLNDLAAKRLVDEAGAILPRADWARPELDGLAPKPGGRILVVPNENGKPIAMERQPGSGFASYKHPDWPVLYVSLEAAVEYAHWLTEKRGGPWRFRPPTDLEWEKAARGVDGRTYVWGGRLVRSFARALDSSLRERNNATPEEVGTHPADESPYGVRDLTGSASEPTLARALPGQEFFVYRGANWDATSSLDFHAATRNRLLIRNKLLVKTYAFTGIRLVAVPGDR